MNKPFGNYVYLKTFMQGIHYKFIKHQDPATYNNNEPMFSRGHYRVQQHIQ